MAYVYQPPKKKRVVSTFKKGEYQEIYSSPLWRKLRQARFKNNPICQKCLEDDKVTPTNEVHHIIPFKFGLNINEIKLLAYTYDNTISLCTKHHKEAHMNLEIDTTLRLQILGY